MNRILLALSVVFIVINFHASAKSIYNNESIQDADADDDDNYKQIDDDLQNNLGLLKGESESEEAPFKTVIQDNTPDNDGSLMRERRRLSVFRNIYHECRVTKRMEKNFCLYLANLYQNVKGYHGI